ncbi:hypothetical protein ACHAXS_006267 [Conticribra weissflogii]
MMLSHDDAMLEFSERVLAMRHKEETAYKNVDYLSPEWQQKCLQNEQATSPFGGSSASSSLINEMWREKICEWCYQVVDHFDFNREIVSVAMSYLDRYLATRTVTKKIFQLAAMTSLYVAIKLYEPSKLRMSALIDLSRGYFAAEHIVSMEDSLLQALGWHVHPPTPFSFVRDLSQLLPPEIAASIRHDASELARFLTELSVCDYYFVTRKHSSVAIAALINAIDINDDLKSNPFVKSQFLNNLMNVGIDISHDQEVADCYTRLRDMYIAGGYAPNLEVEEEPTQRIATVSPVSVFDSPNGEHIFYSSGCQ